MSQDKVRVYMAGAMEMAADHGTAWRSIVEAMCYYDDYLTRHCELISPADNVRDVNVRAYMLEKIHVAKQNFESTLDVTYVMDEPLLANIVSQDIELIKTCNVLAVWLTPAACAGLGTMAEMSMAAALNIPMHVLLSPELQNMEQRIWTASLLNLATGTMIGSLKQSVEFLKVVTQCEMRDQEIRNQWRSCKPWFPSPTS